MAKQFLLNILIDTLGKYVEGLAEDNLKVGVWSGKIELSSLRLKPGCLDDLNLPLDVKYGSLKSLKLKIPWASLESKPVQVAIDGIIVVVQPLNTAELSAEEIKRRTLLDRNKILQSIQDSILDALRKADTAGELSRKEKVRKVTYVQQLTTKILDNLEVILTNVHIRYEDRLTIPSATIAAGLTLDVLSLATTDKDWNESFVTRDMGSTTTTDSSNKNRSDTSSRAVSIHKLGRMENVGIYWTTDSTASEISDLNPSEIERIMKNLIYVTSSSTSSGGGGLVGAATSYMSPQPALTAGLMYVLPPPNNLVVKMINSDVREITMPSNHRILDAPDSWVNSNQSKSEVSLPVACDISVESINLAFSMEKRQYQQLLSVLQLFAEISAEKQRNLSSVVFRPNLSPLQNPKAWWRFAASSITGRHFPSDSKVELALRYARLGLRYVSLLRAMHTHRHPDEASQAQTTRQTTNEQRILLQQQVREIEEELPLGVLSALRKRAAMDMAKEDKKEKEKAEAGSSSHTKQQQQQVNKPNSTYFFSSWFGVKAAATSAASSAGMTKEDIEAAEDQRLIAKIEAHFLGDTANNPAEDSSALLPLSNYLSLRFKLKSSASAVVLLSPGQPIARLELSADMTAQVANSGSISVDFAMTNLVVHDLCTQRPLVRKVLLSQSPAVLDTAANNIHPTSTAVPPRVTASSGSSPGLGAKGDDVILAVCPMAVTYVSLAGSTVSELTVKAPPIVITWNEVCITNFLSVLFARSMRHPANAKSVNFVQPTTVQQQQHAGLTAVDSLVNPKKSFFLETFTRSPGPRNPEPSSSSPTPSTMHVIIEIDAPKFVIPDNSVNDVGCLLLDTGHLVMKASMGPSGMDIQLSLMSINVGMPKKMIGSKSVGDGVYRGVYLIQPFSINVALNTLDKTEADMCMAVEVTNIAAELDSRKIVRLLNFVSIISRTFVGAMPPGSPTEEDGSFVSADNITKMIRRGGADDYVGDGSSFSRRHNSPVVGISETDFALNAVDESIVLATPENVDSRASVVKDRRSERVSLHIVLISPSISCRLLVDDIDDNAGSDGSSSYGQQNPNSKYVNTAVDTPAGRMLVLSVSSLETQFSQRQCDMRLKFSLSSVSLFESSQSTAPPRPLVGVGVDGSSPVTHFAASALGTEAGVLPGSAIHRILWTSTIDDRNNNNNASKSDSNGDDTSRRDSSLRFINICYTTVSSKQSTYYNGRGTNLEASFAHLNLDLNEAVFGGLQRFITNLSIDINAAKDKASVPVVTRRPSQSQSLSHTPVSPSRVIISGAGGANMAEATESLKPETSSTRTSNGKPIGMKISFGLKSVSLDLSKPVKGSSMGDPRSNITDSSSSSSISASSKSPERCFSATLSDFSALADLAGDGPTSAEVTLRSFNIVDCRPNSVNYVYKDLLCSTLSRSRSNHQYERNPPKSQASEHKEEEKREPQPNNILSVNYEQPIPNQSNVVVCLQHLTSYLSLDAALALSDIAMKNVTALTSMLAAFSVRRDEEGSKGNEQALSSSMPPAAAATPHVSPPVYAPMIATDAYTTDHDHPLAAAGVSVRMKRTSNKPHHLPSTVSASLGDPDTAQNTSPPRSEIHSSPNPAAPTLSSVGSEYSGDEGVSAKCSPDPDISSFFHLTVKAVDPRLIFIEDPCRINSKAIVCRCACELVYCTDTDSSFERRGRDQKQVAGGERCDDMKQIVQFVVDSAEVFTLNNLQENLPLQILEPTGLSFNMTRRFVNGSLLMCKVAADFRAISAKVSVKDIQLVSSILKARGTLPVSPYSNLKGERASLLLGNTSTSATHQRTDTAGGVRTLCASVPVPVCVTLSSSAPSTTEVGVGGLRPMIINSKGSIVVSADIADLSSPLASHASADSTTDPNHPAVAVATVYDVTIHFNLVTIVYINDFHGRAQPVIRCHLDGANVRADGAASSLALSGEGSLILGAEYYNPRAAYWEPVIEKWVPNVTLSTLDGLTVTVHSSEALQINISGGMVSSLWHTLHLIELIQKGGDQSTGRTRHYPLVFLNQTGLPIDILDGKSGKKMVHLSDENRVLTPFPMGKDGEDSSAESFSSQVRHSASVTVDSDWSGEFNPSKNLLPDSVDMKVLGPLQQERKLVQNLPLRFKTSRLYYLKSHIGVATAHGLPSEPVTEEVYENQRFDPLHQKWSQPWSNVGEPHSFSDAAGQGDLDPKTLALPSDRWGWLEESWVVDLSGRVGVDIDEHGWEYGTAFAAFHKSNNRRAFQSCDSVRRRRWIRHRVPKGHLTDRSSVTMSVSWDVALDHNGCRTVTIRSGLVVRNMMPFALQLLLNGFSGTSGPDACDSVEFGPILAGESLPVPLLFAHATSLCLRPVFTPAASISAAGGGDDVVGGPLFSFVPSSLEYDWSPAYDCRVTSDPIGKVRTRGGTIVRHVACADALSGLGHVFFQAVFMPGDRSLTIIIAPYVTVHNHLPCQLSYRCFNVTGKAHRQESVVLPGGVSTLSHVSFTTTGPPRLQVAADSLGFCPEWEILRPATPATRTTHGNTLSSTMYLPGPGESPVTDILSGLCLRAYTKLSPISPDGGDIVEVHLSSRYLLVDRTGGLDISVLSKIPTQMESSSNAEGSAGWGSVVPNSFSDMGSSSNFSWDSVNGRRVRQVERKTFCYDSVVSDFTNEKAHPETSTGTGGTLVPGFAWARGRDGGVAFDAIDDCATINVNYAGRGVSSDPLPLRNLGAMKVPFEVVDSDVGHAFQLAYSTRTLPGVFQATDLVTVMPAFTLANLTPLRVQLKQSDPIPISQTTPSYGSGLFAQTSVPPAYLTHDISRPDMAQQYLITSIDSQSCCPWHKLDCSKGTTMKIRVGDDYDWSFGTIDLNEIGARCIVIPRSSKRPCDTADSYDRSNPIVLQVDVKFSKLEELSYITVVFSTVEPTEVDGYQTSAIISFQNCTDVPIAILQDGLSLSTTSSREASQLPDRDRLELRAGPGTWIPVGWVDPSSQQGALRVIVGESFNTSVGHPIVVSLLHNCTSSSFEADMLHYSDVTDVVVLTVHSTVAGRLIHAVRKSALSTIPTLSNSHITADGNKEGGDTNTGCSGSRLIPKWNENEVGVFQLVLQIGLVAVSLIADRPTRREFFCVYVQHLDASVSTVHALGNTTPTTTPYRDKSINYTSTAGLTPVGMLTGGRNRYFSLKVMDLQIDNFSETCVYPVMLHSYGRTASETIDQIRARFVRNIVDNRGDKQVHQRRMVDLDASEGAMNRSSSSHFLVLSFAQHTPTGSTRAVYKYVAVRLLEVGISIDSSTLQLYLLDLHEDLVGANAREESPLLFIPSKWIDAFNARHIQTTHSPSGSSSDAHMSSMEDMAMVSMDIHRIKAETDQDHNRAAIVESVVLHPLKARINFVTTSLPRDRGPEDDLFSSSAGFVRPMLGVVKALLDIENFVLKVNSFIVEDASETISSLISRVAEAYVRDIRQGAMQIAGSLLSNMKILGKPAALYRNIGGGVRDFFYEPYEGAMQSPAEFFKGVGKGTGSLLVSVASGAIASAAGVVEVATKGVSKGATILSGDAEYARQREDLQRQQQQQAGSGGGGFLAGLKAGGESVFSGFSSGLSGLVTKPFEEGQKGGAVGFVKGLGLGALGAVAKPVMGISDGLANVARGVSSQVNVAHASSGVTSGGRSVLSHIPPARPRRVLERALGSELTEKILVPLIIRTAKAQECVRMAALADGTNDAEILLSVSAFSSTSTSIALSYGDGEVASVIALTELYVYSIDVVSHNAHGTHRESRGDSDTASTVSWRFAYSDMSHAVYSAEDGAVVVQLVLYQRTATNSNNPVSIVCRDTAEAIKLYSALWQLSSRMGSPASMKPPPHSLTGDPTSQSSSYVAEPGRGGPESGLSGYGDLTRSLIADDNELHDNEKTRGNAAAPTSVIRHEIDENVAVGDDVNLDGYVFGRLVNNIKKFPPVHYSEKSLLEVNTARFLSEYKPLITPHATAVLPSDFHRDLDEKVWQLIYEWNYTHPTIKSSRCLATLIINRSDSPVQIVNIAMLEGRNFALFGCGVGGGYEPESKTILPGGGAAVLFSYGFTPSLIDLAHVKVDLSTSAFVARLTTRKTKGGSTSSSVGGFSLTYLEKSKTDWWAKYVMLVL